MYRLTVSFNMHTILQLVAANEGEVAAGATNLAARDV